MIGHDNLTMVIDASEGRSSSWRRCFGSSMRWWSGLALVFGWRFGSTMFSPEIRVFDGVALVWWLSIKGKAMGWIDVGKDDGFVLVDWKEVDRILVVMMALGCGGVLPGMVEWAEMSPVCPTTEGLLLSSCGIVSIVASLVCFLLQFVLDFGFSFQISPGSFESGLLSEIRVELWFWVIGPFFIGPNRLAACSRAIVYQPALMTMTSMSMSNAWMDYLNDTSDQLCCFLVIFDPIIYLMPSLLKSFDWSAPPLLSEDN